MQYRTRVSRALLVLGLGCLPLSIQASDLEDGAQERLQTHEQRLSALERSRHDDRSELQVNGYITLGAERTNTVRNATGETLNYAFTGQEWDFSRHTRAGLQFSKSLDDRTTAAIQLVSRGDNDFEVEPQWAYLSYELGPSVTVRAGRIMLPFYQHSQQIDVGYTYPWVQLPDEVYTIQPTAPRLENQEGVDVTWRFRTGPVHHSLNMLVGTMDVQGEVLPAFQVRDQHGMNLRSNWGDWQVWAGYTNSWVSQDLSSAVLPGTPFNQPGDLAENSMDRNHAYFASGGLQYDDGTRVLKAERNLLGVNTPTDWHPDIHGMYVMAGYRFGRLMPHVTWGYRTTENVGENPCEANPSSSACMLRQIWTAQQEAWTLGIRYELQPGIALKFDATRYGHLGDNGGFFNDVSPDGIPDDVPDTSNSMVFRGSIDLVF